MKYQLQALTLTQPWAHAIAHLGKRIENRTWAPPTRMLGRWMAIHAGKKLDREALEDLVIERAQYTPAEVVGAEITVRGMAQGAILAVARLDGWVRGGGVSDHERRVLATSWAGAEPELVKRAEEATRDRWWAGPVGWVFGDVVRLAEPVPHVGAQGLWVVSPEACRAIRAQFRAPE